MRREREEHPMLYAAGDGERIVRLLRGRVVLREESEDEARTQRSAILWTPTEAPRERKSHRGRVLGMGEPGLTKWGHEVPWGFTVGDLVLFHFEVHEGAATRPWIDGEDALWLTQYCVDAVLASVEEWRAHAYNQLGFR